MKKVTRGPVSSSLWALVLAIVLTACHGTPKPEAAALKLLQGNWEGKGPGGGASVTIAGNSLRFWARPDFWYETTFTLPAGPHPRQLHAAITRQSGSEQADVGKVVVALYKIEGENLTLGVVDDFAEPPPSTVPGDWDRTVDVFYLKRAQPGEAETKPLPPAR